MTVLGPGAQLRPGGLTSILSPRTTKGEHNMSENIKGLVAQANLIKRAKAGGRISILLGKTRSRNRWETSKSGSCATSAAIS